MSTHAQYRAAVAKIEALRAKHEHERHQAEAELQAALPFLGDDIFVLIAAELDARMLGRLACTAQRFWRPSVPDPAHKGSAPPELWSVAEEGARRRLAAQSEQVRGWVSRGAGVGGSWLRALGEAEKLQRPLRFTDHGVGVLLGEEGALAMGNNYKSAVCGEHEMRRGQHYATFTLRSNADAMVGVAGVDFDCASLEPGPLGWAGSAYDSPFGWAVGTEDSELSAWHNGSEVRWEGQPQVTDGAEPLKEGDVVVRLPSSPAPLYMYLSP
eukprot:COSAG04_NODE_1349_length_7133_cov_9.163918_5_plen_269_part_00